MVTGHRLTRTLRPMGTTYRGRPFPEATTVSGISVEGDIKGLPNDGCHRVPRALSRISQAGHLLFSQRDLRSDHDYMITRSQE